MTKTELKDFVDRVYASWNQIVPATASRTIYEAWYKVLHDLTVVDVEAALEVLIIRDGYMPRPGTMRRAVKGMHIGALPPGPMEAWQELRSMAEAAHNGEYRQSAPHECVSDAIQKLGGSAAFSLHTNGDREAFCQIYTKVVEHWEDANYAIASAKAGGV